MYSLYLSPQGKTYCGVNTIIKPLMLKGAGSDRKNEIFQAK